MSTLMAEASSRIFHTSLMPSFSLPQKRYGPSFPCTTLSRHSLVHCSVSTSSSNTGSKTAVSQLIPWGCDVDTLDNASSLQQWLSDSGLPPQKMAIQRVKVGERGLVALKNIRKGENLLFVPPSLFITADSVRHPF